MNKRFTAGLCTVLLTACANTPHQPPAASSAGGAHPAAGADAAVSVTAGIDSIRSYAAAIKAASNRSEYESDSRARADLAAEAAKNADACLAMDPRAAACLYGKALADGLEAHEHPTRAPGLLSDMLQNLDTADGVDPNYDQAGPSRVKALVLVRAPSWPLGPGDADAGLAAARRAMSLQPDYPPNVLAFAEALGKTGDPGGAHDSYAHARDLAQTLPPGPERDDWLRQADAGLQRR